MTAPFGDDERLASLRLEIRACAASELPDAPWAKAASDILATARAPEQRRLLAIAVPNGEIVGAAVIGLDRPAEGAATFDYVVIAPEHRYRGVGGEAGLAIERRLREAGYGRIFAAVPDTVGLAVYFWLRLGLRPLLESESPAPYANGVGANGTAGIWMVRDTD